MKTMITAALLLLVGTALAVPIHVTPPKRDPHKRTATVAGSGLDASITNVEVNPDGSAVIQLAYKNAGGRIFTTRAIIVPLNHATPIIDSNGNQVSATVPAALGNAIDAFNAQLQSLLTNAANAGKLDL